ncbi:hypothetical protein T440DRAFT_553553 [Plenodomus tracheiphilus IPT5]|uniref:RING-type domain-containing protein n=1 Tax=Plenodomus tracheiphilus IPT5 TaxID=1408161 RepID=A0A6A7BBJ9_9PLEO|nr:hypothetical protein T440DRAFT_553553 [Plenodomus tracheiphilus IPT5]
MGTLTGDIPRLDAHCPHKLATSCRLTSTANCCACADERQHSRTYRVYIDGVGFVQRGTRWQGYCWFCKEFWSNRLAATEPPLEISQTRIPEIPDQSEFLERWNEFHQGYRAMKLEDGSEQRIVVLGEPFKEVSPGFLPRSLHELEAGVENDARRPENRFQRRRLSDEEERPEAPQQSLEDALDNLLQEADDAGMENSEGQLVIEATVNDRDRVVVEPTEPARPLTRREAQQQRRREQFQRVFGSREDLQQEDYESPLTSMYSRAYDRYQQAEERRADSTTTAPPVNGMSVQERRDIEEQLLWGVMRDSQAMSEGTEREGDVWSYAPRPVVDRPAVPDDSSPAGLLSRLLANSASDRHRRIQAATTTMPPPNATEDANLVEMMYQLGYMAREPDISEEARGSPTAAPPTTTTTIPSLSSTMPSTSTSTSSPYLDPMSLAAYTEAERIRASRASRTSTTNRPFSSATTPTPSTALRLSDLIDSPSSPHLARLTALLAAIDTHSQPAIPGPSLDSQPDRPAPKTDEEMTKVLACQVCYQQLADVAVLPCGHMCMCRWCADVVVPVRHSHIPVGVVKCPMCRKVVKQRFRIHM